MPRSRSRKASSGSKISKWFGMSTAENRNGRTEPNYLTMQLDGDLLAESNTESDDTSFAAATSETDVDTGSRRISLVDPITLGHGDKFKGNRISTAKYNAITFLPKFLYQELSRAANAFFVCISAIQQIPKVSPTGRYTTVTPLLAMLTGTAFIEIQEDRKRHQQDTTENRRYCKVFREGTFQTIRWIEVKVGDIVKVLDGQYFPADLIILASSEPQAMCYIETANLDGETNLKIRQGLNETSHITSAREIRAFNGEIECEGPNNRLYKFVGNLTFSSSLSANKRRVPLSADQLLLRGAQLRNTPWVYAAVVYTGHETKLMQNSSTARIKFSNVDQVTDKQIRWLLGLLVLLATITTIGNTLWTQGQGRDALYLMVTSSTGVEQGIKQYLTCIILYNMLIPISLLFTISVVKYCQGILFINGDPEMYDARSDTPARAVTSQLNEELGQVQYIFSDKTGTLTRNVMEFLKASIGGVTYGDVIELDDEGENVGFNDPTLLDNLTGGHPTASIIREWLTLLAVCHTVVPERDEEDKEKIVYQAASPDEAALVYAVKMLGFSFNARTPEKCYINALGKEECYEILNVLEFNSTRKRMSVIVRTPSGAIKLYCKGADSVIYERLNKAKQPFAKATEEHLKRFAADGLRTLCLAVAQLTEQQYADWAKIYDQAATSLVDRGAKIDNACELIEKDLFLLGASAIEDKLQIGVPECIRKLANAGIKIWVLTGDKQETAINIGYSSRLLTNSMKLLICNLEDEGEMRRWIAKTKEENNLHEGTDVVENLALIIDGNSLTYALADSLKNEWLALARQCKAVICCRVSPKQKADIVRLVKAAVKAITLAIGDGANDVGMIQEAHVGVGISGEEGLQAARAADYAIAQFKFLEKLLLVHGSWSFRRITMLVLYYFYKNFSITMMELLYSFNNGFSGQILFEEWMIAGFNVIFTIMPPILIGVFEQHVSAESLLKVPELYKLGASGKLFNAKIFWLYMATSFYHCIILYYLTLAAFQTNILLENGQVAGHWVMGTAIFGMVVITSIFKAALMVKHWTLWTKIGIWGSCLLYFFFILIYCNFDTRGSKATMAHKVAGVDTQLYRSFAVWLSWLIFPFIALFADFSFLAFQSNFWPTLDDIVRKQEKQGTVMAQMPLIEESKPIESNVDEGDSVQDSPTHSPNRRHTGYAFSQYDNNHDANSTLPTQADIIRKYNTNKPKPQGD
eukprot:m.244399 g.244399  ORF g.244399 m.244399 type:complete len:1209 (-) comp33827_c0_seq1:44-3670(-)